MLPGHFLSQLLAAVATLFAVVDPLGTAAIYVGLRRERPVWGDAWRAFGLATATLAAIAVAGAAIDGGSGRVRGALLASAAAALLATALFAGRHCRGDKKRDETRAASLPAFLCPLAFPLFAGPGCIATTMALAAEPDPTGRWIVTLAVVVVEGLALLALVGAARLLRSLAPDIRRAVAVVGRLMLVAAAIRDAAGAIEIVWP